MSVHPLSVTTYLHQGQEGEFILDPSPVHHMMDGLEMCFYPRTKIIYETVLKRLECELRLSSDKHLHTYISHNALRYSVSHICTVLETDFSSWLLLRILPSFFFFFSISQSGVWGQKMKHVVHCTDCKAHWGDVLVILDSITTRLLLFFLSVLLLLKTGWLIRIYIFSVIIRRWQNIFLSS